MELGMRVKVANAIIIIIIIIIIMTSSTQRPHFTVFVGNHLSLERR
jgi:hypothetical protein